MDFPTLTQSCIPTINPILVMYCFLNMVRICLLIFHFVFLYHSSWMILVCTFLSCTVFMCLFSINVTKVSITGFIQGIGNFLSLSVLWSFVYSIRTLWSLKIWNNYPIKPSGPSASKGSLLVTFPTRYVFFPI